MWEQLVAAVPVFATFLTAAMIAGNDNPIGNNLQLDTAAMLTVYDRRPCNLCRGFTSARWNPRGGPLKPLRGGFRETKGRSIIS